MKENLEKSLKRYLKRKVKITLGFITAFAIMGNVGLAANTTDYETAEKYLGGIENTKLENGTYENGDYKITVENGNINFEGFANAQKNTEVLNNLKLSEETKKIVEASLNYFKENGVITEILGDGSENLGITDINNDNGQQYVARGGINNGILIANGYGQQFHDTQGENPIMINNGLIIANNSGQILVNAMIPGKMINNGTILSNSVGQEVSGTYREHQLELYNYGYVYGKNYGQKVGGTKSNNIAYNYGILESNKIGQYIEGKNSTIKNNGVINILDKSGIGQHIIGDTNIGYNYGLINAGAGTGIKTETGGTAYNKGVITIDDETKIFSGDNIINNGIVIVNKDADSITGDITTKENNGVILDKGYNLVSGENENVTAINNGDKITNSSLTNGYIKDGQVEITENLVDKTLNTVVTENSNLNGAVFTYNGDKNNDLNLVNTDITGYFEKGGTLLEVTGGADLIIAGDTQITAVKKDITDTDVIAVEIGEGGNLAIAGTAGVNGKIVGTEGTLSYLAGNSGTEETSKIAENIDVEDINISNANDFLLENNGIKAEENYTNINFKNTKTDSLNINFETTAEGKTNKIILDETVEIGAGGINGTDTKAGNDLYLEINNIEKIGGDIKLGAGNDEVSVEENLAYKNKIDLGAGDDTLVLKHAPESDTEHIKTEENTFNYDVRNTETINLVGGHWHIENAHIGFDGEGEHNVALNLNGREDGSKAGELHVEINSLGAGVSTSLDKLVDDGTNLTITANGGIKYVVGDNFNVYQKEYTFSTNYNLGQYEDKDGQLQDTEIKGAVIFDTTHKIGENGKEKVTLRVKEANELGLGKYKAIYDTVLENLSENKELRDAINYADESKLVGMIEGTDNKASAFYTTGYVVTKDVTDMYMDTVESFGKKAGAREWLAFGKYVSSDTEFDGGNSSRGYDGDITGTIGMIEYGVNDTTSYGAVFGKGDTEVDINGGGKLDGDNTYFGAYVKHTTQSGIELLGNVGFTKSELDAEFRSFAPVGDVDYSMISDGSSDADALTVSLKGKKAYSLTETLKVEPMIGARYTFISQDAVESSDANFRMDEKDVTIFEGMFGADIVKDFAVFNGRLSLKAGAEYSLLSVSDSDDARYTLYGNEIAIVDEEEIADSELSAHVGFDYEHENGIGFDAKYEYIWTDKGDDNRVEAGISYRF